MEVRRKVCFLGTVQGVFFRATACDVAKRFIVTGFVRNLSDGRVEMVVEGDRSVVDAFVAAVVEAKRSHIEGVECEDSAATGEFDDFGVAY
jgi:acylphosphatase